MVYSTDRFIEEEKEDLICLEGAQSYIKMNKQALEAQNEIVLWPDIKYPEEKLADTKIEAV